MTQNTEKQTVVDVAERETKTLVETVLSAETVVSVGKGASLTHYRLAEDAENTLTVRLDAGASYTLITLALGTGKLRIAADLAGEGAVCRSDVVYAATDDEVLSLQTDFTHNADKTVSRQLVKGAANGRAKASFEGRILIPYDKKEIDGSQQHRALLLSRDCEIAAVPRLEIYADDVKCAHGSAVGSLNAEQLYYMRARGLDENEARRLLTTAFLNEVLDGIRDEALRSDWEAQTAERIGL